VIRLALGVVPWFVPGVVLSVGLALLICRPVGRRLGIAAPLVWVILVAVGLILSATLLPLRAAVDFQAVGSGSCDLSRIGLAPVDELLRFGDTSLNVALFIPLGLALGLVGTRRSRTVLLLAAAALPFAIEGIQLVAPILDRGCQSADVFDNLTGLVIGLIIGTGARILAASPDRQVGTEHAREDQP
jgi:glycopeptide antibiotics resistance protein